MLHYQEWGEGDPVIALHPLALEATAFEGVAGTLARRGLRTLAVDMPGFGRTPAPDEPLTPACLAAPVLELARSLERPPLLVGMSLGARVALEVALTDPDACRGLVLIVPALPWRRWRTGSGLVRWLDPRWAEKVPLEKAWPLLKRLAESLERIPDLEHDWLARASVRVVYYSSCPATRVAFLSAAREMVLEPASGPESVWSHLPRLAVPATFLWAGRDLLIPKRHREDVADALPSADQVEIPCSGHFVSGAHFRCMRHAIDLAVARTLDAERAGPARRFQPGAETLAPCLAHAQELDELAVAPESERAVGGRGGSA